VNYALPGQGPPEAQPGGVGTMAGEADALSKRDLFVAPSADGRTIDVVVGRVGLWGVMVWAVL
jgi:hypothetical protein